MQFGLRRLREFEEDPVWREILVTTKERMEQIQNDIDTIDPTKEPGKLARAQGEKANCSFFLSIIEIMKSEAQTQEEEAKNGS